MSRLLRAVNSPSGYFGAILTSRSQRGFQVIVTLSNEGIDG